ncbi:hypothetical protein C7444_1271 [Sphaerotilus hippei]|uniref:Uncharacterized protein n=1 Tax=Sphaerotilus hippei TaxID=744406 RepID=A0A318GUM6_9BURK|nr:hypothetical protein [Sphaerotilus hippei]PXW92247.1 hypothetical protein C7444_1271 [Sphaerotilus hippei]
MSLSLLPYVETVASCNRPEHPGHKVFAKKAEGVFKYPPESRQWHNSALYIFHVNNNSAGRIIYAMSLDGMTEHLMVVRQKWECYPEKMFNKNKANMRQQLLDYSMAHPDKSGKIPPDTLVESDLDLAWYYLRAGYSPTATADILTKVTGLPHVRQNVAARIDRMKTRSRAVASFFGKKRGFLKGSQIFPKICANPHDL